MSDKTILVWFRNDLRVNDNEILLEASRKAVKIVPVYIFDPYYFKRSANGFQKTGSIRAQFLIESVTNLRENLKQLGGNLLIRIGDPAELLPALAEQYQVSEVYHHREVSFEETTISENVEAALWKIKINLRHFIGHTLYHKEDLPFPIKDIPDSFATFKKKIERDSLVRAVVPRPEKISIPGDIDEGALPTLTGIGLEMEECGIPKFRGGETAGERQLEKLLTRFIESDRGKADVEADKSAFTLSPWLASGCLSPRQVYWALMARFNHQSNPIVVDLLWRDYFRFMFKKHGSNRFINPGLLQTAGKHFLPEAFEKWRNAKTGEEAVNAAMRRLNCTGYIDNYSRQLLASYLIRHNVVPALGALWFEAKLVDYSPASNWGNWAFMAGNGTDAKPQKYYETTLFVPSVNAGL